MHVFLAANLEPLLGHSKSFGPSAPIAYATSVSPPDEAVAWLGRWYQVLDEAVAWLWRWYQLLDVAVAWQGCRCWMQDEAAV